MGKPLEVGQYGNYDVDIKTKASNIDETGCALNVRVIVEDEEEGKDAIFFLSVQVVKGKLVARITGRGDAPKRTLKLPFKERR